MALKGPAGALTQLMMGFGGLIAITVGYAKLLDGKELPDQFQDFFSQEDIWQIPILVSAIQVILLLFAFPFETPHYLKQNGDTQALKSALTKIYKTPERANQENDKIVILNEDDQQNMSILAVICDPRYRRATFVGCMLIAIH